MRFNTMAIGEDEAVHLLHDLLDQDTGVALEAGHVDLNLTSIMGSSTNR